MTTEQRIAYLVKRIETAKTEVSRTVLMVSTENNLVPGIAMNLVNLQQDLTELKVLEDIYRGRA